MSKRFAVFPDYGAGDWYDPVGGGNGTLEHHLADVYVEGMEPQSIGDHDTLAEAIAQAKRFCRINPYRVVIIDDATTDFIETAPTPIHTEYPPARDQKANLAA